MTLGSTPRHIPPRVRALMKVADAVIYFEEDEAGNLVLDDGRPIMWVGRRPGVHLWAPGTLTMLLLPSNVES